MSLRRSLRAVALLVVLCALSVWLVDVPLARWAFTLPPSAREIAAAGTNAFDFLSGKSARDTGLALVLFVAALVLSRRPGARRVAKLLVLVALCNAASHQLADLLKPAFGRLRPHQIAGEGWVDQFFAGGTSFPSGHTAFYWGIALPLAWALPRWRAALVAPPLFVAVSRVVVGNHFAADVLAGAAVSFAVSGALIALFERRLGLVPLGAPAAGALAGPEPVPVPTLDSEARSRVG